MAGQVGLPASEDVSASFHPERTIGLELSPKDGRGGLWRNPDEEVCTESTATGPERTREDFASHAPKMQWTR